MAFEAPSHVPSARKRSRWVVYLSQDVWLRLDGTADPVARLYGPRKKAEANARLAALAPEALAALIETQEALEAFASFLDKLKDHGLSPRLRTAMKLNGEFLAIAEGK